MFIIDLRNKNVSEYRFSVMNNNDVDEVQIFTHDVAYSNYSIYLKVMSDDETYADKIAIDSEHKEVVDDALIIKWLMSKVFTQFKQIKIQLQFEGAQGEELAQSRIVTITLNDTLPTDRHIEKIYPDVLKKMQKEIDDLKARVDELEGN